MHYTMQSESYEPSVFSQRRVYWGCSGRCPCARLSLKRITTALNQSLDKVAPRTWSYLKNKVVQLAHRNRVVGHRRMHALSSAREIFRDLVFSRLSSLFTSGRSCQFQWQHVAEACGLLSKGATAM